MRVIRWQNYTHKQYALFFENTKVHKGCKNKEKMMTHQDLFFVKGLSNEGHVTKSVEWINFGLLILYKTKVLILQ